jgi:hypothetical protein
MMFSYKYWVKEEPETDQRGGCVINLFIYSLTEILLSSTPTLEDIVLSLRELTGRRVKRLSSNTKQPWISIQDFQFIQVI